MKFAGSVLVEDIPQIAELDCNPFLVREHGAVILDARVRIAATNQSSEVRDQRSDHNVKPGAVLTFLSFGSTIFHPVRRRTPRSGRGSDL